jgi:hypothetical protein
MDKGTKGSDDTIVDELLFSLETGAIASAQLKVFAIKDHSTPLGQAEEHGGRRDLRNMRTLTCWI